MDNFGVTRCGFDGNSQNALFISNFGCLEQFGANPHLGTLELVTTRRTTQNMYASSTQGYR